jgi:hypothetical protein
MTRKGSSKRFSAQRTFPLCPGIWLVSCHFGPLLAAGGPNCSIRRGAERPAAGPRQTARAAGSSRHALHSRLAGPWTGPVWAPASARFFTLPSLSRPGSARDRGSSAWDYLRSELPRT